MKKLRVMLLMHKALIPPDSVKDVTDLESVPWKTEYDVAKSLKKLGHEVHIVGIDFELSELREAIEEIRPEVVFNLLVEFQEMPSYDQYIVGYLEMMKIPYTGCNPRGLMLANDKPLSKKILKYHRLPTPNFFVVAKGHRPRLPTRMSFPMIVKSSIEEASLGISQSSIVHNEKSLQERVQFIHEKIETDALVESYIEGRELYVGVLGNQNLTALPVWELDLQTLSKHGEGIATSRVKWNEAYRKKHKIRSHEAKGLGAAEVLEIQKICKRVYKRLGLNGYARIDLRLADDGQVYVIEANPNPGIAKGEEFTKSAEKSGLSYEEMNQKLLSLGLSWFKNRR